MLPPYSVAIEDVNGDGKPDLLVANFCQSYNGGYKGAGAVSVLLGNGDGTFQAPVSYNSGGNEALSVTVGDLNGDDKPDVVVANACQSDGSDCINGEIGVLLAAGDE